jgi:hypothetical protein
MRHKKKRKKKRKSRRRKRLLQRPLRRLFGKRRRQAAARKRVAAYSPLMKFGKYHRKLNFEKLEVATFPLFLFNKRDYEQVGCGASALSLLTGLHPNNFQRVKDQFSDRYMIGKLRGHGFSVYSISKADLTNGSWGYRLNDKHVLLYSALIRKHEASWFVQNGNFRFHNFAIDTVLMYDLLNFPILNLYCITHPRWGVSHI